jgi:hypothetical protein
MNVEEQNRALRMLAAGDEPKTVAAAVGTSVDEVRQLKADFPGTTTQPVRQQPHRSTAPDLSRAHTAPVALVPTDARRTLVEQARTHSNKRVQNLGRRAEQLLSDLATLIADTAVDEQRKQAERAAKQKARADVERLQRELAAARAKLRGNTRTTPPPIARPAGDPLPCRKGCGRTSPRPQGRAAHERHCTGPADE